MLRDHQGGAAEWARRRNDQCVALRARAGAELRLEVTNDGDRGSVACALFVDARRVSWMEADGASAQVACRAVT